MCGTAPSDHNKRRDCPAGQGCLQAKPWKGHETTAELSKAVSVLAVTGIRLAVPHVAPGGALL